MFSDNPIPTLAYKFDIYATNPGSRKHYYIDANTGEVVFSDAIIKHVSGLASTRYSGQRTIETEQVLSTFRLKDNTRGNGITTYNNFNQTSHTNTHYVDNDNNWTALEYNNAQNDNVALDAHWGSMMTYDYFSQIYNRNSIDNNGYKLINCVNSNLTGWGFANSDNAFWDGSVMAYGMGTALPPLVTLDIVAHEIGHGLTDKTSNLVYRREPGAIDEGISDIWGAMVEFFAAPEKDIYLVGNEIGFTIRSMSNPQSIGLPDTYRGINWLAATVEEGCITPEGGPGGNDFCGVHTNSSILNHWFYLLAEGSSATDEVNDNGDPFSITGIGKLAASKIIYRAQTVYFTSTTNYQDARNLTIQAAEDLYGAGSNEAITTCQSWFAVGVGNNDCNFSIEGEETICTTNTFTYNLIGGFPNVPVQWSTNSNLSIVASNNLSITVQTSNVLFGRQATITANVQGETVQKTVWIGKPAKPTNIFISPSSPCVNQQVIAWVTSLNLQFDDISFDWNGVGSYLPQKPKASEIHFTTLYPNSYSTTIRVKAINSCGVSQEFSKTIWVDNCGWEEGDPEPDPPFNGILGNRIGDSQMMVYPNPASDKINVVFKVSSGSLNSLCLGVLNDFRYFLMQGYLPLYANSQYFVTAFLGIK